MSTRSVAPVAKQKRSAATEDLMLQAAEDILREQGLEACTVQEVARRAGRSPASIYRRFGDKDGLIQAVFERYLEVRSGENISSLGGLREGRIPLGERVFLMVQGVIEGRRRDWRLVDSLRQHARQSSDPAFAHRLSAFRERTLASLEDLLLAGEEGIHRPDPRMAAKLAVQALLGLVETQMREAPERFDTVYVREITALLATYLSTSWLPKK